MAVNNLAPGHLLGRYEILECIGSGGMAKVYRAMMTGEHGFSRIVALKVLHPELSDQDTISSRFISEARISGYLSHPAIVQIYDFGSLDGVQFLAMEFIDGVTLAALLSKLKQQTHSVPLPIAIQLIHQICQGLEYAHTAQDHFGSPLHIVHRDLKPSNILISRHGEIKIADFGIARAENNANHTLGSGVVVGTAAYMSPEQAMGERRIDQRSDLFNVCLIFFELLSGERFYNGPSFLSQLRLAQDADLTDLKRRIPDLGFHHDAVISLLKRGLAHVAENRFKSAREISTAMQRILDKLAPVTPLKLWLDQLRPAMDSRGLEPHSAPQDTIVGEQVVPHDVADMAKITIETDSPELIPTDPGLPQSPLVGSLLSLEISEVDLLASPALAGTIQTPSGSFVMARPAAFEAGADSSNRDHDAKSSTRAGVDFELRFTPEVTPIPLVPARRRSFRLTREQPSKPKDNDVFTPTAMAPIVTHLGDPQEPHRYPTGHDISLAPSLEGPQRFRHDDPPEVPRQASTLASISPAPASDVPHRFQQDSWQPLTTCLPASFRPSSALILEFLSLNFEAPAGVSHNVFRLTGVKLGDTASHDFFCILMEGGIISADGDILGTRTFVAQSRPLETYLKKLDADITKVVLVICDSQELGKGVNEKILDFKEKYEAIVLPFSISEIQRAKKLRILHTLLEDRIAELHTPPDDFIFAGRSRRPLRVYGLHGVTADVVNAFRTGSHLLVICGPPGSGKSTVVDEVEMQFDSATFLRLRCAEASTRLIVPFISQIVEALTGKPEDAAGAERNISQRIRVAVQAIQNPVPGKRAVLVLEDADWLIKALVPQEVSPTELDRVRELWSALAHEARAGALMILITSMRGYILKDRVLMGWDNPISGAELLNKELLVPSLNLRMLNRLLQEMGRRMNLGFHPEAIKQVHQWSGGNVEVACQMCSQALKRKRENNLHNMVMRIEFQKSDIEKACQDLVIYGNTFRAKYTTVLSNVELLVLHAVATSRPASNRKVKSLLAEDNSSDEIESALNNLVHIGLVKVTDERYTVAIPLLQRWVANHIVSGKSERSRRYRYLVAGLSLTAVLAGAYITYVRAQTAFTPPFTTDLCTYQVQYPLRGHPDSPMTFFVTRECISSVAEAISIRSEIRTVARFKDQLGQLPDIMSCPTCNMGEIPVAVLNEGVDHYGFLLVQGEKKLATIRVRYDPLAATKKALDGTLQIAAALPALIGVFLAFHKDMRGGVTRLISTLSRGRYPIPVDPPKSE